MGIFCPAIETWFYATYAHPSPIQEIAWPRIQAGSNCLLLAPTGSGKTFAAFLTLIDSLARLGYEDQLKETIYAVYITPLKALGNDIHRNLIAPLAAVREADPTFPDIRVGIRTGDTPQNERARMVRHPPHILITTPESLFLLLGSKRIAWALESVQSVIIDEVHSLCDNKRGVHLAVSLERLEERLDRDNRQQGLQRIGCSATMKPLDEIAKYVAGYDDEGRQRPCEILDAGSGKKYDLQVRVPLPDFLSANNTSLWNAAFERINEEIENHDTTLVFCNSRYRAEKTSVFLEKAADDENRIGVHHGSIAKEVRLDVEERLKRGDLKALVATSSLELGIDIGSVNLVYHLESPKTVASGLQRVGRAGHLLDTTSKGRILVFDRDELAEAAVIARSMLDGKVDSIRIPTGSIDVLAQQVTGMVSVKQRSVGEIYRIIKRSYPYASLSLSTFETVLKMLAGEYKFAIAYPPRALVMWDRNSEILSATRSASHISNMNVGTIAETSEYEVVLERTSKRIGRIEADFVDDSLRSGDVFTLGNSSWRVNGKRKNQVLVEEAPGSTPTVPWWVGGVVSRTAEVGREIGRLRREAARRSAGCAEWLASEYHLSLDAAEALREYIRSQQLACDMVPDHEQLLAELWCDELGRTNIIIHCPLGQHINRTWGLALTRAASEVRREEWTTTSTNDLLLLTLQREPVGGARLSDPSELLVLVNSDNLEYFVLRGIELTGGTRFRAIAACALQILRAKDGKRIPVWLQNYRAQQLFDAAVDLPDYPLFVELTSLLVDDTLDIEGCAGLLREIEEGDASVASRVTSVPSPFAHGLLVRSQYTDGGHQMGRARRAELLRLHQKVLEEILTSDEIAGILDQRAIDKLELELHRQTDEMRAENRDELVHAIREIGEVPSDLDFIANLTRSNPAEMIASLVDEKRLVAIRMPNCEEYPVRLVPSDLWRLYYDAFDDTGLQPVKLLVPEIEDGGITGYAERLVEETISTRWRKPASREVARRDVLQRFLRSRGPVTTVEVINHTGWLPAEVHEHLEALRLDGVIDTGVYTTRKQKPQWIYKSNLERIHRKTLRYLKRELAACAPYEVVDFMTRWQHLHPDVCLEGIDGLREAIRQIQGLETLQAYIEPDILAGRVRNYEPAMLDSLIASGEVRWLRLGYDGIKRGRLTLCLREDLEWLSAGRKTQDLSALADEDIPEIVESVRGYFVRRGTAFFDDLLRELEIEEGYALRAIWHLVWTGEITCDTYECLRNADFTATLSACYDLASTPKKILRGVTTSEAVVDRMKRRGLDPRKGRWSALPRLMAATAKTGEGPYTFEIGSDKVVQKWTKQLLRRWGIVTKEMLTVETAAPSWGAISKELKRLELMGKVQRGYFIESYYGTQYGLPDAIELLRECRARRSDGARLGYLDGEKLFSLCGHDPANLYIRSLEILDDRGLPIHRTIRSGNVHIRMAMQAGQVVAFAGGRPANVRLLTQLDSRRLRLAVRSLVSRADGNDWPLAISGWNGHAIDLSPAARLLWEEGFRFNSKGEMVYPPVAAVETEPGHTEPAAYMPYYSEESPVCYDEEYAIGRTDAKIRQKLEELFTFFREHLPSSFSVDYRIPLMVARYRGKRCAFVHVQKKRIRLYISFHGWAPGIAIEPATKLDDEKVCEEIMTRFTGVIGEIDAACEK